MQDLAYSSRSGYAQAHERIRNTKVNVCSEPGCSRTDVEIALIHGRGRFADQAGIHAGIPYSKDPDDYISLCRSHHRLYDLAVDSPTSRQLIAARKGIGRVVCEQCGKTMAANNLPMHSRYCGQPKPKCKLNDCEQVAKALGMCNTHYERWRKHGDPTVVGISSGQFPRGHIPHNARHNKGPTTS